MLDVVAIPKAQEIRAVRAKIVARAPDAATAVPVVRAAERAIFEALGDLAEEGGEELLVVKAIEVALRVGLDGSQSPIGLTRALRRVLRQRIEQAREHASTGCLSDIAWFPSVAAAVAEKIVAVRRGRGHAWPFPLVPVTGNTTADLLVASSDEGPMFFADVLAHLARIIRPGEVVELFSPDLAVDLLARFASNEGTFSWETLPDDVLASIWSSAREMHATPGRRPAQRLALLAAIFATWPPARALAVREVDLDDLLDGDPIRLAERRPSSAGGLVAWAYLLESCGFDAEVRHAYPEIRHRRAVRWALGRALEASALSAHDPLLVIWSGEPLGSKLMPDAVLAEADPEPLHRFAIRSALRQSAAHIRIVPFGAEFVALLPGDIVADSVVGCPSGHSAVPEIVGNFIARFGAPPDEVEVVDSPKGSELDAISAVDVPGISDRFRPAVRAAASVARSVLTRTWNLTMHDLHGWQAFVTSNGPIHVRRRNLRRVFDVERSLEVMLGDVRRSIELID
jgi:hypothetical protein